MRYVLDPLSPTGISKASETPSYSPYFAGGPGKVSLLDSVNGKHGAVQITAGTNVTIDNTGKDIIKISSSGSGGGGTVDTVVAGTLIDVDATDPANPIVSVETLSASQIQNDSLVSGTTVDDALNNLLTATGLALTTSSSINDLADVDTISVAPNDGEVLTWNAAGGLWIPGAVSGSGGITRVVTVTSANYTASSTALVDYIYLIAGAHTTTLPTALSNSSRYTFKNNHSANVTINRDGTDTIEGATSLSLPPGNSIDLISDAVSNWNII